MTLKKNILQTLHYNYNSRFQTIPAFFTVSSSFFPSTTQCSTLPARSNQWLIDVKNRRPQTPRLQTDGCGIQDLVKLVGHTVLLTKNSGNLGGWKTQDLMMAVSPLTTGNWELISFGWKFLDSHEHFGDCSDHVDFEEWWNQCLRLDQRAWA